MILEIEKTVVEGAAAAGFAARAGQSASCFAGRKVGIVLSGGNIDMRLLSNVILRELTREGRILTLVVADRGPARLAGRDRDAWWARPAAISWKSPTTA